jgi:acyl-[acyl-carrier-protein]-phospholipid O-acyltransferase / long-chain-fatty-acid--[acyl-carrier-protein] ligase
MMRTFLKLIFLVLFRVRVHGDAAVLTAGPVLVIANHDCLLDGLLLGLFLPRRALIVMSRDEARAPLNRALLRFVRHRVADLSEPATAKLLLRLLAAGELVVMFPQGRATTTASAMKLYPSVAVIASRSAAPIVPVTVSGLLYSRYSLVPGTFARRRFPRVTIRVEAANAMPAAGAGATRAKRRAAADALSGMLAQAAVRARQHQTLFEALCDAAKTFGREHRIVEDVRGIQENYGDLLRATLAFARLAPRLGATDEVIGILMPNLSTTVGMLVGLGAAARVPAMLNYTSGAEALRCACVAAKIGTVVTSRKFIEAARLYPALDALCNQRIVFVEDLRGQFGLLDKLWLVAWARWRPRSALRRADPSATAVVLFTSGSEARPKGVALSHDALLANIAQMRAVIDFSPADCFLNALPMFHSYGLTACTLMPLLCGVGLYLYTTPLRYRVIPEIAYLRDCTFMFGTSTFLARYGREANPLDFYRLRYVISGAEKLNPDVAVLWQEKFGLRILEGYGATECSPVLALNTPRAFRVHAVGRFLPEVEHRLVPVDGISRGGRLHVRGPNLMRGYYFYDEPGVLQPPQSELGPGWYDTGDVVDVDREGFVTVLGRVKRFAKIAGEMVALEAVERVAQQASPQHRHAAMLEILPGVGESTVLLTTDPDLSRGALQRSARALGSQDLAVARRIAHVAELPMLGSGKTDYVALRTLIGVGRPKLVETDGTAAANSSAA